MADNYKQLTGLTQGTEYEFRICAIGDQNVTYSDSEWSTIETFTTLIKLATPAPSVAKTTDSLTVSWSVIPNATGYVVAYKHGSGAFTEETVTGTTFALEELNEGETYVFKVKAISSQTTVYEESDYSSEVTETTQTTLGVPIPTLTRTTNSITATWAAIANATGYVVAYKTGTGAFTEANVATTSFSLDNLAEGVTYVVKVKAVTTNNEYANSGYSAEATATTQITLNAPTFAATFQKNPTSIAVRWTHEAGGYNGSRDFVLSYKTGSGSYIDIDITSATDLMYLLQGLAPGTAYTFKIKAISTDDNYVDSVYSAEKSVTTPIQLATPTGLVVTDITTNSAKISWNSVAHALGYTIQYRKKGDETWTSLNGD